MHAACRERWHHRLIVLFLRHFFVFDINGTADGRSKLPARPRFEGQLYALRVRVRLRQHDAPIRLLVRAPARATARGRAERGARMPVPGLLCR